jgi:putative AlgH/UPF0301 family transcriptional regulator
MYTCILGKKYTKYPNSCTVQPVAPLSTDKDSMISDGSQTSRQAPTAGYFSVWAPSQLNIEIVEFRYVLVRN